MLCCLWLPLLLACLQASQVFHDPILSKYVSSHVFRCSIVGMPQLMYLRVSVKTSYDTVKNVPFAVECCSANLDQVFNLAPLPPRPPQTNQFSGNTYVYGQLSVLCCLWLPSPCCIPKFLLPHDAGIFLSATILLLGVCSDPLLSKPANCLNERSQDV